jgi:ubiquinone/menaquinone biosynthesis C-methylase UbiE
MEIHARLGSLADETRTRLLLVLSRHELSVNELCGALRLPQSTVSRHLKVLGEEGWLATRADGPSRYYRMARLAPGAKRLWQAVRQEVAALPESAQDEARVAQVLNERRARSQDFFSSTAGQWDGVRAELFGARAGLAGLLALLPDKLVVGDLGCGSGVVAAELAPFTSRVIAVDESKAMLAAARRRLAPFDNVDVRAGPLEALPVDDGELDAAVLSLVLHYVAEPVRVLEEARRALHGGGRVVVIDMLEHGRAEWREQMGHVWQGFSESVMRGWLEAAGFGAVRWHVLPADLDAKGPVLFVCSGSVS